MTTRTRAIAALQLTTLATSLLLLSPLAAAQSDASKAGLERAQKAADAVFHWIKLNADKGASRAQAAPAPAPAPAARKPVAAAPRPAPAPVATPAVATAAAPVVAAAPQPASIAASPEAEAELARSAMLLASAPPTSPAEPLTTPMAVAAQAAAPSPPPQEAAEEAEVPLKLVHRVNPSIPTQMQKQTFRDGFARVKFTVEADGSVKQVQSLKASHNRLATAAIDAVKQWRFAPIPAAREAAIEFAFNNLEE